MKWNVNIMYQRINTSILAIGIVVILGLAFLNLADYPLTWFDEGSHLHVPKALVQFGKYADFSSEGFRYSGPSVGVGPTVMLPIAAIFKIFGIGLLQARLVTGMYLVGTVIVFYFLAKQFGSWKFAIVAVMFLVVNRSTSLVEYGRQVLGEVPGLFFLVLGLLLWFKSWNESSSRRLVLVGICFGLAMVTKYQYVIVILPALFLLFISAIFYYRSLPVRVVLLPGLAAGVVFAAWQGILMFYHHIEGVSGVLAGLQASSGGAALVFSTDLMQISLKELLDWKSYVGALLPALIFGFFLMTPDTRRGQTWFVIFVMVMANFVWFVLASVSWVRYAFPGLALMSLPVAKFIEDLSDGYRLPVLNFREAFKARQAMTLGTIFQLVAMGWLVVAIVLPLGYLTIEILNPPANNPVQMGTYLNQNVPLDSIIETWEPELGFLTDHNYHYPPNSLLDKAVRFIWIGGPPPSEFYRLGEDQSPDYLLLGKFSQWVGLYNLESLPFKVEPVIQIGTYQLFLRTNTPE